MNKTFHKIIFFAVTFFLSDHIVSAQEITTENLKQHIGFLAGDKLKGRGTSSLEEMVAAKYIAKEFKKLKLQPKGTKGYFQPFTFKYNSNPHDSSTANAIQRKGTNVIGYLDNNAQHTIVIGAHYDHLGLGKDHNSLDANPENKIHNGADDNASGVAGVLALANYYASNNEKEKNNFLFICFSGEELGLIGSKKFTEVPTINLKEVNCMINMDMIGRLNDTLPKIMIYGVGTAPDFVPIIDGFRSRIKVKLDSSGIGPSDQTSFYLKDIPVLHFFTGQHSDYHKPSDDADKINYEGEKTVLEYIVNVISEIEKRPKLAFMQTRNPDMGKKSFKVTMGVMPDYAFEGNGMRIDGVTEGKPAFKAGLKKGDVIIGLGESKVANVQDYMKALNQCSKGQTLPIKVLRDGAEKEMSVTF